MNKRTKIIFASIAVTVIAVVAISCFVSMNKDGISISNIGGTNESSSTLIEDNSQRGDNQVVEYTSITMNEAKEIFKTKGDYMILDVRRADEFAQGHIPGAINVANEYILSTELDELPDKNQVIYVYCRSGRRSKEASAKLAAMGYKNIIECGGILDWIGEVET